MPESWIGQFIIDAHALQDLFSLGFALDEDNQLTEWLPLIAYLSYYAIQCSQVRALFMIGEDFILTNRFIYLCYVLHFK